MKRWITILVLVILAFGSDSVAQDIDFNSDGRADLFAMDRGTGEWATLLSDGAGGFGVGQLGGGGRTG